MKNCSLTPLFCLGNISKQKALNWRPVGRNFSSTNKSVWDELMRHKGSQSRGKQEIVHVSEKDKTETVENKEQEENENTEMEEEEGERETEGSGRKVIPEKKFYKTKWSQLNFRVVYESLLMDKYLYDNGMIRVAEPFPFEVFFSGSTHIFQRIANSQISFALY